MKRLKFSNYNENKGHRIKTINKAFLSFVVQICDQFFKITSLTFCFK